MSNDFHSIETDVTITEKEDLELRSLAAGMTLCGEKYRLDRRAGKGGMGIVWKAWDAVGERWVALKFISPEIRHSETAMTQVKAAFQAIQELSHPNICPIYGLENDPGFGCFVVMKWLEGRTLSEAPLPKEKIRTVLEKAANALDHAHSKKVIHRDVKPSNILIANDGEVYLIDFGIARQIRSETQATQGQFSTSGTDKYMAPEQRSGQYQSAQTDEYSLALVALELLTGSLSPMAATKLSPALQTVLGKALSDAPKDRYATCREFVNDLFGMAPPAPPVIEKKSAMEELIKAEREAEEAQRRAEEARIQAEEARKRAEEERLQKQIQELENAISEEYKAGKYQEALAHIAELQKLQPKHANARWLKKRCEKKLKAANSTYTKTKGKRKFLLWLNVLWVIPVIILTFSLNSGPFEKKGTLLLHYRGSDADVVIPKGITEIGFVAFRDNKSLTTLVIPEGVTKIERLAFWGCSSLTSVTLPESLAIIEYGAFQDCKSLTSVVIPDSVYEIDGSVFAGCTALKEWSISSSHPYFKRDGVGLLTKDGKKLVACLASAKEYRIPEGVKEIGGGAFDDCNSLTSVVIPDSVVEIGNAFYHCQALKKWVISFNHPYFKNDGIALLTKDGKLIACPGATGEYRIPEGVTEIGEWAFYDCDSLISVNIPKSVTKIDHSAFSCCNSLTSVEFPEGEILIESWAFDFGDSKLTIHAPKGSTAEKYAKDYNIPFKSTNP